VAARALASVHDSAAMRMGFISATVKLGMPRALRLGSECPYRAAR
jgi:hypothetical protein